MPTSNIIQFPPEAQPQSSNSPTPVKEILPDIKSLLDPIPPERIPEAKALLKAINLPESAATSLNKITLNSLNFIVNLQHCETCHGKIPNCDRLRAEYRDGEIYIYKETCQESITRAKSNKARKLINRARVPAIFRDVKATDFLANGRGDRNPNALTAAEAAIFDDASLYIYGGAGTGKTFLAAVIANERAYEGKASAFVNVPDILEDLRDFNQKTSATENVITRQDKLNFLYRAECLIIDDLGAEKPSDWTCETLFKIINRRYNDGKQLIVTSNFTIEELQARMNYVAGDRIIRRICDICQPVEIV